MLMVKVSGLAVHVREDDLNYLHETIVSSMAILKRFGLEDEKDVRVFFYPDLMKDGLGEIIIIEVTGHSKGLRVNPVVCQELADNIGKGVNPLKLCQRAKVVCLVSLLDLQKGGYWESI